jgi:hypothetical protein
MHRRFLPRPENRLSISIGKPRNPHSTSSSSSNRAGSAKVTRLAAIDRFAATLMGCAHSFWQTHIGAERDADMMRTPAALNTEAGQRCSCRWS